MNSPHQILWAVKPWSNVASQYGVFRWFDFTQCMCEQSLGQRKAKTSDSLTDIVSARIFVMSTVETAGNISQ